MKFLRIGASLGAAAVLLLAASPTLGAAAGGGEQFMPLFVDALDAPAVMTRRAPHVEMVGVAQAGKALVAVGARGVILRSEDGGARWNQVPSPVSTDLASVFFANESKGWAVGHEGVILHTVDGGRSWVLQLEGRALNKLLRASYARIEDTHAEYARAALASLDRIAAKTDGPVPLPFLDVWFTSETEGFVVGAFNLLLHTTDAGKTWEPWDHLTDNPKTFHLNAVRGTPAGLFVVGERGLVLRWNAASQRFLSVNTGYGGSFFGVHGDARRLVVYGLRGNARISTDGGRTWSEVKLKTVGNVINVVPWREDELLFLLQDGNVIRRDPQGALHKVSVDSGKSGEVSGAILLGRDKLVTTGLRGPQVKALSGAAQ